MLKNIDFNKNRQRWKNYFCLFISFLFLIFFYVNRTTILENDPEFSSKFKIASIVLGWIVGVVLIFVRLDFGKKWNRVINILYILFAPCYIFFNDTATTEIYTLSLHDALPISRFVITINISSRIPINRKLNNNSDKCCPLKLYVSLNTAISIDRKSTRLNSSHPNPSRMPSSA